MTTVGYGTSFPAQTAGNYLIASVLMLAAVFVYTVVTGVITSALVARAQADSTIGHGDPVMEKLQELDLRARGNASSERRQSRRATADEPTPPPLAVSPCVAPRPG